MDPALTAWLAGVITWACAALVDFGEREVKFKGDRRFVEGQIAGGSLKADEVGELDQYAANKLGEERCPTVWVVRTRSLSSFASSSPGRRCRANTLAGPCWP